MEAAAAAVDSAADAAADLIVIDETEASLPAVAAAAAGPEAALPAAAAGSDPPILWEDDDRLAPYTVVEREGAIYKYYVIVEHPTDNTKLLAFWVESAYLDLIAQLQRFFDAPLDDKLRCRGDIYFNERGVPMWQTGFEKCGEMRQAFRIHAGHADRQSWPDDALRAAWLRLLRMCERICDRALSLALGYPVTPPENKQKHDFSVCYALCYPNDATKYSEELNVTEHVDPSLFVVEPCCGVAGLEVLDTQSRAWVAVEAICRPGKDLVLFGGKALQEATDGAISGTLHRVRRGPRRRHCFIYEQKYDDFFPAPLD
ncbi:hypothetical protein JKP88DRAFT_280045 [Tribonema minus]|uniref:Isopenicillin N synthase-like Fe(2+) 2OG dioxygenase domain-containing protein n=1 Tax=Tribonema minus TaxID=303371 RepID=A0A836CDG4_9STRA|nr:hypothetical protein JKP88DRAFT_280045 [Tribonema minus]